MQCNCIKELEEKIKEKAMSEKEYEGRDIKVNIPITALVFTKTGCEERVNLPCEISYDYETKSGKQRTKKNEMGILASYCPFCGKEIKDTKEEQ